MQLTGKNWIGTTPSAAGTQTFQARDPRTGQVLSPAFLQATAAEIDCAAALAEHAAAELRLCTAGRVAGFLDSIAEQLERVKEDLVSRAGAESGLPAARLNGEHARTVGQIRMFSALVREGSWVDARIDTAMPDRQPISRPDLRRMLVPIGPVAVFGASNFPLAFSVAGGDTASALAAKNPVIVKAHPAHPGTSEIAAAAILAAAKSTGMPDGIFSMLHGTDPEVSLALVRHPAVQAVGFTGSLRAGRALFDACSRREQPIPVYAEMGSMNPVFVLPGAVKERSSVIARGLRDSVTLGAGQFCTCPGLVIGTEDAQFSAFADNLRDSFREAPPATMLHSGILDAYEQGLKRATALLQVSGDTFLCNSALAEEIFGPATILVRCASPEQMAAIARALPGSLTATVHGTETDLQAYAELLTVLSTKAGRLIFNGYPTSRSLSRHASWRPLAGDNRREVHLGRHHRHSALRTSRMFSEFSAVGVARRATGRQPSPYLAPCQR